MIKKVIALVFVSFFVMSGLTVLTENNQNYNISINNINNFIDSSSFSPYDFSLNESITYSTLISSSGQTFVCYNNSLYYIKGNGIMKFNTISNKITTFLSLSIAPLQLEIYDNYLIIGYGSEGNSYSIANDTESLEVNIFNFFNTQLYTFNLTYEYNGIQFFINNELYISEYSGNAIHIYSLVLSPFSLNLIKTITVDSVVCSDTFVGYNNNLIFMTNTGSGTNELQQYGYVNLLLESLNTSISSTVTDFGLIGGILDLGNCGIAEYQSYYITNKNTGGTTQYSYNGYAYDTNTYRGAGLFYADSNFPNLFIPINLTNYAFTKLPVLSNNSNYQEFNYNGNLSYVYLPIGSGNTIFNSLTYIINGNNNLYIVNNNNVYVYHLHNYNLNVKSYNKFNNQIQDYFSLNGIIYTGYSNSFSFTQLPQILLPLNTSTYYYNGSAITIIQSDFSGSGSNLYYNLSIYYNQVQAPSIPLYDIFTYIYPISIIGLFTGMGAFIFTIKKRGYKI